MTMQSPRIPSAVKHASAWHGADMARDTSWMVPLDDAQRGDIRAALERVRGAGGSFAAITPESFPLPHCEALLTDVRHTLRDGRGFVLLRRFPIDGLSVADAELAYWGFCMHLGVPVTQNAQRELIVHITDKGPLRGPLARGYATANEAKFHIDLTDVVGLLCLRQAKEGGHSRIASSVSVLNAVLRERPDLLPLLRDGFPWDRRDEHGDGESPEGPRMPIFSERDGQWACRYNRGFIEAPWRRRGEPTPAHVSEALDFIDAAAARPEHVLEMDFQPGDIQLLSNDTILHARTAFTDHPEADRKRLLLRIWLQMREPRPLADPALLRDAFVRYGNLGKTVQERAAAE